MRKKNTMWLCMRYSCTCKLCPRSEKCDIEINNEKVEDWRSKYGIKENKYRKVKRSKIQ